MQLNDIEIEETEQASPEEEAMLAQVSDAAMAIIHSEGKAGDNIAQMVLQSQDVMEGIGRAAATVVLGVERQTGSALPDDIKMALAEVVIDELASLAIDAGALAQDELTADAIDQMASHAVSNYLMMQEATGQLDPNELKASVEANSQMFQQGQPAKPQQPKGLLQMAQKRGA